MAKYLLLYRGPATPTDQMTAEQSAESLRAWGEWMARVRPALVDVGSPLGQRVAVGDDGSSPAPSDQNGYSIVQADGLDAARRLVEGHPFLSEGRGRFSVEVFELLPMPT